MSITVGRGNEDEMNNLVSWRGEVISSGREIRSVWLMLGISHRLRVAQIFLLVSNIGGLGGKNSRGEMEGSSLCTCRCAAFQDPSIRATGVHR
jgi:hypothetical protein